MSIFGRRPNPEEVATQLIEGLENGTLTLGDEPGSSPAPERAAGEAFPLSDPWPQGVFDISSGDFPKPDVLAAYEKISPGMAARLLEVIAKEAEHRRQMETHQQEAADVFYRRGQLFGAVIGIVGLIAGMVTGSLGSELAAVALSGAGIVGLVSVFLIERAGLNRVVARSKKFAKTAGRVGAGSSSPTC